jgi:aspartyl-tRNA(Asn)/glutamyl-tRNA(Gln) amidotransferase subunit B
MNFEAVIGLEIHVEMNTKSKMFSSAPVTFKSEPNAAVVPLDLAHPGTMPVVNRQAIINAIRVCHALHLTIDRTLWFDRKNYFYPDLPKGYQITQAFRPIGSNGFVELNLPGYQKKVEIERLHVEEDTAMQHHYETYTLVDYNRAGIPLMEIVTRPDIRNGTEAAAFVERIRSIVTFANVSTGKMEEGSLRCDVNISIRPVGVTKFGTKVEIKNLNSMANVEKAIDFEMERQEKILLSGGMVIQETRRYDDVKKETIAMRQKTDAVDYKYFVEPNIAPIRLSEAFIQEAIATMPELAETKFQRYTQQFGLLEYDAQLLIANQEAANYFDQTILHIQEPKFIANWINGELASYINKNNQSLAQLQVTPKRLAQLIQLIVEGTVSNKQARSLFEKMLSLDGEALTLAKQFGFLQISDVNILQGHIDEVLSTNAQSIEDYRAGKDRALQFLMAQIMKRTQGKAHPEKTNQLLLESLNHYGNKKS